MRNHLEKEHSVICTKRPGAHPPNPSRKRRRVDEESAQVIAANTSIPWDKAELSNRIQKIIGRLQDIRGEVSEVFKLHESDSASNLDHNRSTTSDQHLRTSSLVSRQLYGRVAEKKSILKLMMLDDTSTSIIVLPIVGIAGVGKTALTQHVYNEPNVASPFQHRVWIWVSRNFDEVRVTREMLNFVSRERHEEINCFVKLQEILKIHVKSKRVLIILDDVWDDMNDCRWNQLLAPFKFNSANGNVILVTTRKLSVAKMVGTIEPIKLGALEEDDFWLLFKSCALGDRASENPGNLCTIGQQIAEKLKGNPLAPVTAGALLRDFFLEDPAMAGLY
ncbi:disease resistance protein RGA2-like isoform X2 [Hordeum vulgare subsp. vulgare]|uniref:disease resistance protein RGA2-like isoform X2 n=1 Tax=Hordeum vulgare subsp. vulgare TaxID=112509 RepID=UPI001D1A3AE9|nr:disease resistance protein RGA2-like isoform X2 [Hordeum vulgare subsp. vulgare]